MNEAVRDALVALCNDLPDWLRLTRQEDADNAEMARLEKALAGLREKAVRREEARQRLLKTEAEIYRFAHSNGIDAEPLRKLLAHADLDHADGVVPVLRKVAYALESADPAAGASVEDHLDRLFMLLGDEGQKAIFAIVNDPHLTPEQKRLRIIAINPQLGLRSSVRWGKVLEVSDSAVRQWKSWSGPAGRDSR
jgi:hypothetical protein